MIAWLISPNVQHKMCFFHSKSLIKELWKIKKGVEGIITDIVSWGVNLVLMREFSAGFHLVNTSCYEGVHQK